MMSTIFALINIFFKVAMNKLARFVTACRHMNIYQQILFVQPKKQQHTHTSVTGFFELFSGPNTARVIKNQYVIMIFLYYRIVNNNNNNNQCFAFGERVTPPPPPKHYIEHIQIIMLYLLLANTFFAEYIGRGALRARGAYTYTQVMRSLRNNFLFELSDDANTWQKFYVCGCPLWRMTSTDFFLLAMIIEINQFFYIAARRIQTNNNVVIYCK